VVVRVGIARATYEHWMQIGYWLREEAAEDGISIANTELQTEFNKIKAHEFTTPASFQRLLNASRQTIPDLPYCLYLRLCFVGA
jgi:hypothetical protein